MKDHPLLTPFYVLVGILFGIIYFCSVLLLMVLPLLRRIVRRVRRGISQLPSRNGTAAVQILG